MKTKYILFLAVSWFLTSSAQAGVTPVAISILGPVEFPPPSFTVTGVRASALWGIHRNVYGIDIGGVGNITEGNFGGIQASGIFNLNKGNAFVFGAQVAGITNINANKVTILGLQVSAVLNHNKAESSVIGAQVALANYSPFTKVGGLQVGLYNRASHVYGFQIGLMNVAEHLHGVQIGLLNFNKTGLFSFAPFINVGF